MKKSSLIAWWQKFELIAVILLLLWGEMWNIPIHLFPLGNAIAYGLVVILVITRWKNIGYWLTKDWLLISLVGLALASVIWSKVPEITIADTRSLLRTSLFGAYLGTRYSFDQQLKVVAYALAIATLASIFISVAFPSYGIEVSPSFQGATWMGMFSGKQSLGRMMAIATISCLSLAVNRKRWIWLGFWCLAIIPLWFSKSQTALISLVVFTGIRPLYIIVKQGYKTKTFLLISSFLLISFTGLLFLSNLEFIVVDLLGKNLEFNGRTPIWTISIVSGLKQPWLGYGISAFWPSEVGRDAIKGLWSSYLDLSEYGNRYHSHNGFLDLFMQLGLVGLGLFLVHLIGLIFKLFKMLRTSNTPGHSWAFQIILFQIFFNMTESMTMLSGSILWALYVAFTLREKIESSPAYRSNYSPSNDFSTIAACQKSKLAKSYVEAK